MIRYRIISTLGLDVVGDEIEESTPLSLMAEKALARKKEDVVEPVLTVIQEAICFNMLIGNMERLAINAQDSNTL